MMLLMRKRNSEGMAFVEGGSLSIPTVWITATFFIWDS